MKRRRLGSLAGSGLLTALSGRLWEPAQAADASLLKTTLTPFGSERAGNAVGTIPAWTGGLTETPAGIEWDPSKTLPPDFFANDEMLYEVNASNMSQYAGLLTDGVKALITTRGFSLKVYPTRRTHAAPQWVYDNIAANVSTAQLDPRGGRWGFSGAIGGIPFPLLDPDPYKAGAQLQWNHEARWYGSYISQAEATYTVSDKQFILVYAANTWQRNPYYIAKSVAEYSGYFNQSRGHAFAPGNIAGTEVLSYVGSNPFVEPDIFWSVLSGQGRVRKAPNVVYDTPSSQANGIVNYDEYYGFTQQLDEYDWEYLGKQELFVPYNNNRLFHVSAQAAHQTDFIDPELMRWELHRVNVVEITLHPGRRNVLPRRKLYYDEDTSMVSIVDAWDGNGSLIRHTQLVNANFPNLPGTIYMNTIAYDVQGTNYISVLGAWGDPLTNKPYSFDPVPPSTFNPQAMAAAASY